MCHVSILGIEQLSLGVRFIESAPKPIIREEFLGFTAIEGSRDADSIAQIIINQCRAYGLDPSKMFGQGYDGCSTMAGKENGVQARIRRNYPKAIFVHCASHRLNLVVNDLNSLPQIRNSTATIK